MEPAGSSALPVRGVMTVQAAGVADVACLLLGFGLVMRKGQIDLLHDPVRVLRREPAALGPADRQGVRE